MQHHGKHIRFTRLKLTIMSSTSNSENISENIIGDIIEHNSSTTIPRMHAYESGNASNQINKYHHSI